MKSIAPIVFRGKYFSIANFFSSDKPNSNSVIVKKSIVSRGHYVINQPLQELRIENVDEHNPSEKLTKIKSVLQINYQYLELNFDSFRYFSGEGDSINYQYDFEALFKGLNKWGIKKKLSANELINVQRSLKYLPTNPQNDFEVQIVINYLSQILSKFNFSNLAENSVLIVSGEMLWSGFLNMDLLINLFKTNIKNNIYLLFDSRALWQLLLSFEESKFLFALNKQYMLPQVYSLKHKSLNNKISVNINSNNKTFILVKKFNLFNLSQGSGFLGNKYLPQYLLVDNLLEKSDKKEFERFNINFEESESINFVPQTQYLLNEQTRSVALYFDDSQKCNKKIGEWLNENETIGSYKKDVYESIFISQKAKPTVFNGQIIKAGDVLAVGPNNKQISAEIAGKVDLSQIKNGQLKIISDKKDEEIKSPISGELVSFSKSEGFIIKSQFKSIFIGGQIGNSFWGRLDNNMDFDGAIIKFVSLKDFLDDLKEKSLQKYLNKGVRGVLIEASSQEEINKFSTLSTLPFGICFLSLEVDPYKELKSEIINKMFGKNVFIENTNLLINLSDEFDMGIEKPQKQMSIQEEPEFKIGEIVSFSSFLTDKICGKIIKLPSPKNQSFLIDNGDRIIDVSLNNLIKIQYE